MRRLKRKRKTSDYDDFYASPEKIAEECNVSVELIRKMLE